MRNGLKHGILPALLLVLFLSGCAAIIPKDKPAALFLENREIMKEYEKEKKVVANPQVDTDEGHCPLCEL